MAARNLGKYGGSVLFAGGTLATLAYDGSTLQEKDMVAEQPWQAVPPDDE